MPRRSILLLAAASIILATVIALTTVFIATNRSGADQTASATGQPLIGGDFELVNQDGQTVNQTMLDGKWSLVFFGFTYCPDFCPTTLGTLAVVQDRLEAELGDKAKDVQIIFISIDPARDTPQLMKDYLSSEGFPRGTIGLTGTDEQVAAAAKAYRAFYQKVGDGENYTMNHGLTVYLMGPDGRFRSAIANDLGPDRSVEVIKNEIARG